MIEKESDLWETPQDFFDELNKEFDFNVDLCATPANKKCSMYCNDIASPNLRIDTGIIRGFMNPPYSNPIFFVDQTCSLLLWDRHPESFIVILLKADTSTKLFHALYGKSLYSDISIEIRFIEGRLKFTHPTKKATIAPFGSMLVILRKVK